MTDRLYKWIIRLFLPHLADSMRQETTRDLFGEAGAYVRVEDRGSDKTIFSFAGGAMLYAGMPTFEFRKMLAEAGADYNLVFLRDASRLAYRLTPDGKAEGLEFYEAEIRRVMRQLGSTYHIAIGGSAGAAASFYFGVRCGFDRIIAFGQPFPLRYWTHPRLQLYNLFNVKKLFLEPGAYAENALLSLASKWVEMQMRRHFGEGAEFDPYAMWLETQTRPRATVFYGERCRPDALNAQRLRGVPDAELVPLPVGLHNSAAYLKKRGELAATIARILKEPAPARNALPSTGRGPQAREHEGPGKDEAAV